MKRLNLIYSLITFLFVFLGSKGAKAQEVWALDRCIAYALEHNLQIEQSRLQAEINQQDVLQAKGQVLPTLNGFANHVYNFGQRIDPFTNQFAQTRVQSNNFNLSSNLTLFSGLQNFNAIKQAEFSAMAGRYNVEDQKNNVSLNVALAYLQILQNTELLRVAESQKNVISQQTTQLEKFVNAGTRPAGDLFEIQAQLANEEANVVNAENNLNLAYLQLRQLMQYEGESDFLVALPEVVIRENTTVSLSPNVVYETAQTTLPSIKSAEYQSLSASRGVNLARGRISPSLTLGGSVGTGYSESRREVIGQEFVGNQPVGFVEGSNETVLVPNFETNTQRVAFNDQLEENVNRSVGLTLQVPIFNGFNTATAINRAKIQSEIAETNLQLTKNQVRQDIEQAHADAVAALKNYRATEKSIESFQTAFDYAQKRFKVGAINAVEFNTAKNNLNQAESRLIQAKYNFLFRMKILDFYMGNPIQL